MLADPFGNRTVAGSPPPQAPPPIFGIPASLFTSSKYAIRVRLINSHMRLMEYRFLTSSRYTIMTQTDQQEFNTVSAEASRPRIRF